MFGAVFFGIVTLFLPSRPIVEREGSGTPSPIEGPTAPPPLRAKRAVEVEDALVGTREVKTELVRRMGIIVEQAEANGYASLASQARLCLDLFIALFAPTVVAEAEPGGFRVAASDPCSFEICFMFVVSEHNSVDGSVLLAAFSREMGSLTVSPFIAEPDGFQAYIVFHELAYLPQIVRGEIVPPRPRRIVEDAFVPAASYAHKFEGEIMNAATGGRYGDVIGATAVRVVAGDIEAFRLRKITFVAWPESLYDLFEDHGRPLSIGSKAGLLAQATIDLNHALLDLTMPPGGERDEAHETVFANFYVERALPEVERFNLSVFR